MSCLTNNVLPKSGVPDPGFRLLQTPATGVPAQVTWGEMPISWNPYLGLTDPSGAVSHTPDPVLGFVKGDIVELSLGYQNDGKTSTAASSLTRFHKSMTPAWIPEQVTAGSGSSVPDPVDGVGKGNGGDRWGLSARGSASPDPFVGDFGGRSMGSQVNGIASVVGTTRRAGGHKSMLSAANSRMFTVEYGSRVRDPVKGEGKGNNGGRYRLSAPETTGMGSHGGVVEGLFVTASGELGFSSGSNLPKTMPSLGSSGLLSCGSGSESPYPFDGINEGQWVGSHVGIKTLLMVSSRKDGFQATSMIGALVEAMCFRYDPLTRRVRPSEQTSVLKSGGIRSPVWKIQIVEYECPPSYTRRYVFGRWFPYFRPTSSTMIGSVSYLE